MDTITTVAVWRGNGQTTLEQLTLPLPGEGELLVRIRMATVCGSDLHTVEGRRSSPCPSVLGHEAVGEVIAGGAGTSVHIGQRIVWSVTVTCGQCDRCRAGRTAKCRSLRKIGHERFDAAWPLSGNYAKHILLPAGTAIAVVPDTVSDAAAAPASCATATIMAAVEQAGSLAGKRIMVSGAGTLGLTAVAAAAAAGAQTITVTDLHSRRLELARRFGATHTQLAGESLPLADIVFEVSGESVALQACLERLDIGGVAVLVGSVATAAPIAIDPEQIVRGWHTITGVHNYEPRHLQAAVEFLANSTAPWADLVAAPVPLELLPELLANPRPQLRMAVAP